MNRTLLQGSVTLAQTFVDNAKGDYHWLKIGENIIRYIYKWFDYEDKNEVEYAISEFLQHNKDCRFECYCCGECEELNNFAENEPSINDEYIKCIKNLLWEFDNACELSEVDKMELSNLFAKEDD